MKAVDVSATEYKCYRCGKTYPKQKTYFPACNASLYKAVGTLPICKTCLTSIYDNYLVVCNDPKKAVRATCRRLDLYWSERVFDGVMKQNEARPIIMRYMTRISLAQYACKSYDDTLIHEGTIWDLPMKSDPKEEDEVKPELKPEDLDIDLNPPKISLEDIPQDVIDFWGSGYTPEMYIELEQRRAYWMSNLLKGDEDAELDIGAEAIIRQICNVEIDINKERMAGRSADKLINTLNTLLGSANLKPTQKKEDTSSFDNRPLGKWIQLWEEGKPVPEPDENLKDVDGIVKFVLTWLYGHLAKMFNVKNAHSKMYEEELNKYRVKEEDFESDDDTLLDEVFGGEDL